MRSFVCNACKNRWPDEQKQKIAIRRRTTTITTVVEWKNRQRYSIDQTILRRQHHHIDIIFYFNLNRTLNHFLSIVWDFFMLLNHSSSTLSLLFDNFTLDSFFSVCSSKKKSFSFLFPAYDVYHIGFKNTHTHTQRAHQFRYAKQFSLLKMAPNGTIFWWRFLDVIENIFVSLL